MMIQAKVGNEVVEEMEGSQDVFSGVNEVKERELNDSELRAMFTILQQGLDNLSNNLGNKLTNKMNDLGNRLDSIQEKQLTKENFKICVDDVLVKHKLKEEMRETDSVKYVCDNDECESLCDSLCDVKTKKDSFSEKERKINKLQVVAEPFRAMACCGMVLADWKEEEEKTTAINRSEEEKGWGEELSWLVEIDSDDVNGEIDAEERKIGVLDANSRLQGDKRELEALGSVCRKIVDNNFEEGEVDMRKLVPFDTELIAPEGEGTLENCVVYEKLDVSEGGEDQKMLTNCVNLESMLCELGLSCGNMKKELFCKDAKCGNLNVVTDAETRQCVDLESCVVFTLPKNKMVEKCNMNNMMEVVSTVETEQDTAVTEFLVSCFRFGGKLNLPDYTVSKEYLGKVSKSVNRTRWDFMKCQVVSRLCDKYPGPIRIALCFPKALHLVYSNYNKKYGLRNINDVKPYKSRNKKPPDKL